MSSGKGDKLSTDITNNDDVAEERDRGSLDSVVFTGNREIGVGGRKVPNLVNTGSGSVGTPVVVDFLSKHFEDVIEDAGNKRDSYEGFRDTLRTSPSRGRLVTDSGTGHNGGVIATEFLNPLFAGVEDLDVETDRRLQQQSRGSPAPSGGTSSQSFGVNNTSNTSSMLDNLAKETVKPNNININKIHPSAPSRSEQPTNYDHHNHHQTAFKISERKDCFGGIFDHRGGWLQKENSCVSLRIPRGAIPREQSYAIQGCIHLDLLPFVKHINWEDGERLISPVPEYHVADGHSFNRFVFYSAQKWLTSYNGTSLCVFLCLCVCLSASDLLDS